MNLNQFAALQLLEEFGDDPNVMVTSCSSDAVQVAERQLSANVAIEFLEKQDDDNTYLCGVRIDLAVDGLAKPEFTVGGIGLGDDETDAILRAIVEWARLHGSAVVCCLADVGGQTDLLGAATVYLGRTGFRGSTPPAWNTDSKQVHKAILTAIEPFVLGDPRSLTAIDVIASVHETGSDTVVRIDGEPSQPAARAVDELSFPAGMYLLKQFYLVRGLSN